MVRNTRGGKSHRRGRKTDGNTRLLRREMRWKEGEEEEYGIVQTVYGDMRVECACSDGVNRVCHIPGKFRRRVWINREDVVLLSIRSFQTSKADVIYKYNAEEVSLLRSTGELTISTTTTTTTTTDNTTTESLILSSTSSNQEEIIDFSSI